MYSEGLFQQVLLYLAAAVIAVPIAKRLGLGSVLGYLLAGIAIGNVIGSNIFNLGLVLGTASLLSPLHLAPATVATQVVPAMIFCLALIPLAYTGERVSRREGILLLIGYAAFLYQVL